MSRSMLAFGLALSLSACAEDPTLVEDLAASEEAIDIDDLEVPTYNLCLGAEADAVLYVGNGYNIPPSALPFTQKSPHGGYAYDDKACSRYVVDVKVGSNMAGIPLALNTTAYDLPSSSAAGGEVPSNAVDCGKYRRLESYHHKKGEGAWVAKGSAGWKGVWNNGTCYLQRYSGDVYGLFDFGPTPGAGWDTYRVAVQVKQRATAQQVKVVLGQYVAPPQ